MLDSNHRLLFGASFVLLVTFGCDRTPPEPKPAAPTAKATTSALPLDTDTSYKRETNARVVAIGDLHGDLEATRRALRTAGVLNDKDSWSGGKTVLVQTGDLLDRGDDEIAMMDLFDRLKKEAKAAGGAVYTLNGNHELMNVAGDLRYVTPGGFVAFENVPTTATKAPLASFPPHAKGRAAAFWPGGPFAKRLAASDVVLMVNDSLFVHGGVLPKHVRYGLGKINREVKAWMQGESDEPPKIVVGEDGPVWTRRYSDSDVGANDCRVLRIVLQRTGAKRMVVGHTVQDKKITSACNDQIWRIDIGLAEHYGSAPARVLAIDGDEVKVLTER